MNMQKIKAIAKKFDLKTARVKKAALIQNIQRVEGNNACFSTLTSGVCGQDACIWRTDCLALDKKSA